VNLPHISCNPILMLFDFITMTRKILNFLVEFFTSLTVLTKQDILIL